MRSVTLRAWMTAAAAAAESLAEAAAGKVDSGEGCRRRDGGVVEFAVESRTNRF